MIVPDSLLVLGTIVYPVEIEYSTLCESGFSSSGSVATDATIALGFKPTAVDTAYPLCDPTSHYLLTIRKVGTTITVWKQNVEVGSYTTTATTYADLLAEALTEYVGAANGYFSRLVVVESALDYAAFYQQSPSVTELWVPRNLDDLTIHTLLDFSNAVDLGADSSGNGNDWTLTGAIQYADTPTNNHCTLNSLDPATTGTLSAGNLTTTGNAKVTFKPSIGQWYYEKDGAGVSYDADVSGQFDPILTAGTYNFGATAWSDTGPTGTEQPLENSSLEDPGIMNLTEHYFSALFTASVGAYQNLVVGWDVETTGFGLRLKRKDAAENWHYISDVAGLGYEVQQGSTGSVNARTALSTPLIVSGDTITLPDDLLTDGGVYLVEVFRRGAESGFNVVTYTGNGVAGLQIPHTLGAAPFFVMGMSNDSNGRYKVAWSNKLAQTSAAAFFSVNINSTSSTSVTIWNSTAPDSTYVTVGTNDATNINSADYALWCWSDTGVYREIGFLGNGSTNGPCPYVDGTPVSIPIWKDCNAFYGVVAIHDLTTPVNPVDICLIVSDRAGELAVASTLDLLSNGYKLRSNILGWNDLNNLVVGLAVIGNTKYRNAF